MPRYSRYTAEQKIQACEDYFSGTRSISQICIDLGMSSQNGMTIYKWVDKYKIWGSDAFISLPQNKSYTKEFKMQAVEEYISGMSSVRGIVAKYNIGSKSMLEIYDVSYSQVYSWVKKYDASGEEALADKRGRHKTDDEVEELELLRRENTRLKRRLEEKDMLAELLKKVQEFERM